MQQRTLEIVGWTASLASVLMFLSYIDQIRLNLQGQSGSGLQALATVINCSLWLAFAVARENKLWPIAIANTPGIILGLIAAATSSW